MNNTLKALFDLIAAKNGINNKTRMSQIVNTALVSMFQRKLLGSTILLRHWAGRNSRGVTQFEGKTINDLIGRPDPEIDEKESVNFLNQVIAL